jgi:hypothetical protein
MFFTAVLDNGSLLMGHQSGTTDLGQRRRQPAGAITLARVDFCNQFRQVTAHAVEQYIGGGQRPRFRTSARGP